MAIATGAAPRALRVPGADGDRVHQAWEVLSETVRVGRRVAIEPGCLQTRNIFSGTAGTVEGFDSVVLACGGTALSALFAPVRARFPNTHILGDAYAPRRLWFATRQAYALAAAL